MKSKRYLTMVLLVALLLSLTALVNAETITLRVMSTTIVENPEGTVEKALAEEFMRQNPNIKIEFIGVPMNDVYTRITTMAIGGDLPDIFTNTPEFISTAYDMGITADLSELLDDEYLAEFYPSVIEESSIDEKLQFMPWFTAPMGLLYRADWLEEAGLEPPQTWDDFLEAAKAMTKDTTGDGRIDQWGFAMVGSRDGSGANRFIHVLKTFGAEELRKEDGKWITELDSPESVEAFRFFTDLYTKHGVVPPGPTEVSYGEAVTLMATEKTGMLITGPHTIGAILAQNPSLEGKIHSVALPREARHVSSLGLYGFSVASTSKHKEAAVKYLQFLVDTENALEWNRVTGRMPTRIEAGDQPQIAGPVYAGFVEALEHAVVIPNVPFYSEVFDIVGEAYQSIMVGGVSPEDAAKEAASRVRTAIKRSE